MKNQLLDRKFTKPGLISQCLKCPICLDVFRDAMRLYCGHTFCKHCLDDFMKDGVNCPQCRTNIQAKNIGIDLLARQIINQFQVFCLQQDCPWKGLLQDLQNHLQKQCMFAKSNKGKIKVKKNEKIVWHQTLDDQVMDKINEHTAKGSLQARILIKTESIKDSVFKDVNQTLNQNHTQPKLKLKTKKGGRNNNKANQEVKQAKTSNYQFFESLFDF